jgi:hypothetical protein
VKNTAPRQHGANPPVITLRHQKQTPPDAGLYQEGEELNQRTVHFWLAPTLIASPPKPRVKDI